MKHRTKSNQRPAAPAAPRAVLRGPDRSGYAWGGLLVLMTCAAYLPLVNAKYIWDDETYVLNNRTLLSVEGLGQIWLDTSATPQYYPLVFTSYWIEQRVWGYSPLGHHLVNVVGHAVSVVLLWRILLACRLPGAWLAAALLAVHPVEVESVAWVTERKNVLSLALALGSLWCYLRFAPNIVACVDGSTVSSSKKRWRWYGLSISLFLAALLSKTVVATLPAVVLVVTYWQQGRVRIKDALPLLPYFALGICLGLITATLERINVGAVGADWDFTPADRLLIAGRVVWFYASKLVWPSPLIFFYPRWEIQADVAWQYLFPLAAAGLVVSLWLARKRVGRGPLAAVLIFGGVLFPALGFFNVYPFRYSFVADHFQYHASCALFALFAAGVARGGARLAQQRPFLARGAVAATLLMLGILTASQTLVFQNLDTLYAHTIAKNPGGWTAYSNLGVHVETQGRHAEALTLFRKALELHPQDATLLSNVGHILRKTGERDGFRPGQLDEIIDYFDRALALDPRFVPALRGKGFALFHAGRNDEAVEYFARSLEVRPRDPASLCGLGAVAGILGKPDEAESLFQRALEINPDFVDALRGLSLLRVKQGRAEEAIHYLQETIRVQPDYADAHYDLGNLYAQRKEFRNAEREFAAAVTYNPRHLEGWNRLGITWGELGEVQRAIDCFEQMLRIDPNSAAGRGNLEKARTLLHPQSPLK